MRSKRPAEEVVTYTVGVRKVHPSFALSKNRIVTGCIGLAKLARAAPTIAGLSDNRTYLGRGQARP